MNMPSGSKPPSGAMPGGLPPNSASNGMASPTPTPGPSTSTSSSIDMSETSLTGLSGGAQTNGLSSSQQSMSSLGSSLYNYVGSIMPTIQPLFKV
jgi:hypothetical protein